MKKRERSIVLAGLVALLILGLARNSKAQEREVGIQDRGGAARDSQEKPAAYPLTLAQNKRPEGKGTEAKAYPEYEELIRRVYMKLGMFNKSGNLWREKVDGIPHRDEDDLKFIINNVHTGPIEEILDKPLREFLTKPGGDMLDLTHTIVRGDSDEIQVLYRASWRQDKYHGSAVEDWDGLTMGDALALSRKPDVEYSLYSTYEVTAMLKGKQRTYRAMLLSDQHALQSTGKPQILFSDFISNGSNLATVYEEKRRPAGSRYIKPQQPKAAQALESNATPKMALPDSCPMGYYLIDGGSIGGIFDNPFGAPTCCNDVSCCYPGLSTGWSLTPACYEYPIGGGGDPGGGGCKAGSWQGDYTPMTRSDTTGHYSGYHAITGGYQAACLWGADCSVQCKVSALTPTLEETGDVGILYSHVYAKDSDWSSGITSAAGTAPPTCGGADAMAVKGCYLFCGIKVSVKWGVGGTDITTDSDAIWKAAVGLKNNCAATAP